MNSKVNFHGQEIDLENLVHAWCITIAADTTATGYQAVFRVRVNTSVGFTEYSFFTEGCQSWEMAKELDSLRDTYAAERHMCEAIREQEERTSELQKEFNAKREEYAAAAAELIAMQRKYKNDYR